MKKKFISLFGFLFILSNPLTANDFENDKCFIRGFLYANIPYPHVPNHYIKIKPHLWIDQRTSATISKNEKVCLIGFAVDVRDAKKTSQMIVNDLENALSLSENQFHSEGDFLCGRYVIFFDTSSTSKVIADATTMRKVFYSEKADIVAGHAKLVSHQLLNETSKMKGFWDYNPIPPLFGRNTPYQNVFLLTPNHTLEIDSGELKRIFPRKAFLPMSEKEATMLFCKWGRTALEAAEIQQPKRLLFCLTAGLDSRVSLSLVDTLTKPFDALTYYGLLIKSRERDLPEAQKICSANGINHIVVSDEQNIISADIQSAMESNCYFRFYAFNYFLGNALYQTIGEENYLIINTNLLELGRGWEGYKLYKPRQYQYPMNTDYARLFGINKKNLMGYNPLQFFFLEQQWSAGLSHVLLYYDLSCDVFNCFNARAILDVILRSTQVPEQMNWGKIQKNLIKNAWYYQTKSNY